MDRVQERDSEVVGVGGWGRGGGVVDHGRRGEDRKRLVNIFRDLFPDTFFCWFVRMVHLNFDRTAILTRVGSVSMHGLASGQLQAAKHEEELARQPGNLVGSHRSRSRNVYAGEYSSVRLAPAGAAAHLGRPIRPPVVRCQHTERASSFFFLTRQGAMCRYHEIFVTNNLCL
jgi:hypothetical protein